MDDKDIVYAALGGGAGKVVEMLVPVLGRFVRNSGEVAVNISSGAGQYLHANLMSLVPRIEQKLAGKDPSLRVSPRVAVTILEKARWTDSPMLQEYWANLLVSAMSPEGESEEALLYVPILAQLTSVQARIIDQVLNPEKGPRPPGDSMGADRTKRDWLKVSGAKSIEEWGLSMQSLMDMNLIWEIDARIFTPDLDESIYVSARTMLIVTCYVRMQGHSGSVQDFYNRPKL